MNHSQHISSSCTIFFSYRSAAIIGGIGGRERPVTGVPRFILDSLERVLIGQQIGTDGREAEPRLDWTREKRYTPKPHVCGAEKSLERVRFACGRYADNVFYTIIVGLLEVVTPKTGNIVRD